MDIKLEKLNTVKEIMSKAPDEELFQCFIRIVDILSFLKDLYNDETKDDAVENKLSELKRKHDFIYYKAIELVFQENVTKEVLIEILTNLLANSVGISQKITIDYITVLAFSSFSDGLRGQGYYNNLANYLLSHFRIDFLVGHWDRIEAGLNQFN